MDTWIGASVRALTQPGGRDQLRHGGSERVYIPIDKELQKRKVIPA